MGSWVTERKTADWPRLNVSGLTSGVTAIAARGRYTCALTNAGGVKCWGNNHDGQLGDGSRTDRNAPVDVTGLTSGVKAIATGWRHSCALMTAGGMTCWGNNHDGQLGDGTGVDRKTPVDVVAVPSGIVAIAAGGQHTCALAEGTDSVGARTEEWSIRRRDLQEHPLEQGGAWWLTNRARVGVGSTYDNSRSVQLLHSVLILTTIAPIKSPFRKSFFGLFWWVL